MNTAFFRIARAYSELSEMNYKMGAVIVRQRPVAGGYNINKTHPVFADGERWYTIHAEMSALMKAAKYGMPLKGCAIYVYREDAEGNPAQARPCEECMKMLIESGITEIYYTVSEDSSGCIYKQVVL